MSDLKRAYVALSDKQAEYDRYFNYYDGDQPTVYMTKRLEDIFKSVEAKFTENWCAVVIDSTKDRINLDNIKVPDDLAEIWAPLWEGSRLKLESDDVHECALITGESFVIAWPDKNQVPQAYFNDPRLCHVFYQSENPRNIEYAAKWWKQTDGTMRMTLYYPDRLEYYVTEKKSENVTSEKAFKEFRPAETNPYGEVPVFHFRTGQRKSKSDLKSVVPVQNGINKLLVDLMVTSEYMAFPQRYIISSAEIKGKIRNAPNEIIDLPAGDGMSQQTQAGQFPAADLKNYLDAIDNLSMAVSSITRTPKHYFFSIGSNLSGEALIAMEAPLNKKAQDRIDRFYLVWQDVTRFMLKIAGQEISARDVVPVFDEPESVQPFTEAQAIQMLVSAGVPLPAACMRLGWTEKEIEVLQTAIEKQQAAERENLSTSLLESLRRFDRGAE